jgi:hypothetical protein
VAAVHRHDQVEMLEVPSREPAGALRAEVVAAAQRMLLRPLVGRLADVIVVRAARFHVDAQVRLQGERPQHALGGRRTADVAGANEEH